MDRETDADKNENDNDEKTKFELMEEGIHYSIQKVNYLLQSIIRAG